MYVSPLKAEEVQKNVIIYSCYRTKKDVGTVYSTGDRWWVRIPEIGLQALEVPTKYSGFLLILNNYKRRNEHR